MIHVLDKGKGSLVAAEFSDLREKPELLDSALWVDLLDPSRELEEYIEERFKLEIPTKEEIHEIEESSRLFKEDGALYMSSWLLCYEMAIPENMSVTFILTKERLVSIRYSDHHPFRIFATPRKRTQGHRFRTADQVFVELLDVIVGHVASTLRLVEQSLNTMSLEIFAEPEKNGGDRPAGLKHVVQQLGKRNSLVSSLRESTLSLSNLLPFFIANSSDWLQPEVSSRLKTIERDIGSLHDYESQLSAEIAFLLDSTVGLISIEQNQSMKILSVAALVLAFV